MTQLYDARDTEEQGEHYLRHVEAMTKEELHNKHDIAAELAHRDMLLANKEEELRVVHQIALNCFRDKEAKLSVAKQYGVMLTVLALFAFGVSLMGTLITWYNVKNASGYETGVEEGRQQILEAKPGEEGHCKGELQ